VFLSVNLPPAAPEPVSISHSDFSFYVVSLIHPPDAVKFVSGCLNFFALSEKIVIRTYHFTADKVCTVLGVENLFHSLINLVLEFLLADVSWKASDHDGSLADTDVVEMLVVPIKELIPLLDGLPELLDSHQNEERNYKHSYEIGVDNFGVISSDVEDGEGVQVVDRLHTLRFNKRISSPIHRH